MTGHRVDHTALMELPFDELLARARAVRDAGPRRPHHLLAQGLHPADHAVPGQVRLLHLRPAPGPAGLAVPVARPGAEASPAPAPAAAATRRCSPWANDPSCATRWPPSGWPSTATPPRSTTWPPCAGWSWTRPACSPTPTPARCPTTSWRSCARCRRRQGMMIESLNGDLAAHRGSPDKTPERRLATLEAAGELQIPFTTGILVGIGESRQDRVDALVAIAESHARHGHVQEVIVQNFLPKDGTVDAPRPGVSRGRLPGRHRARPTDPPRRHPPAGPAQPVRRLRHPARRRHRRLGRRLARDRRPRQPRAAVAGPRPPP